MIKVFQVTCEFTILIVFDSHGSVWTETISESGDKVQLYGLKDKDDLPILFEAEAYHLPSFCEEMKLKYFEFERTEKIEIPQDKIFPEFDFQAIHRSTKSGLPFCKRTIKEGAKLSKNWKIVTCKKCKALNKVLKEGVK